MSEEERARVGVVEPGVPSDTREDFLKLKERCMEMEQQELLQHLGKLIERPPLARLAAVGPKAGDKPGGRLLVACIPHRHRTSRSHLGHRYILTSACPAPSLPLVPPLLALGPFQATSRKNTADVEDVTPSEGEGALFISLGLISVTSPGLVRSWWVPEGPGGDELDGGAR